MTRKNYAFACLATLLAFATGLDAWSQLVSPTSGKTRIASVRKLARAKSATNEDLPFDPEKFPFYHGVASGDPLEDRVIIWTRVTPEEEGAIEVLWRMATDPTMQNVVEQGAFTTNAERDYTVKVDVDGLDAGTTYYYDFLALGVYSVVGKTKTTPTGAVDQLKFAVVSCSNFEHGYFNAYGRIADRTDLDAVVHLGDYIYEYGAGVYGNDLGDRVNVPDTEILTLADYRTRYSLYRLDEDLQRAHQQHPFINVWDDHESANDAYTDGAENHQPDTEGDWQTRKAISKQVYSEWLPIRGDAQQIYRSFSYGDLADLIMVDTRLEGRDVQINDVTDPALYAPDRTLLGEEQKTWLLDELSNSTATWRIVGNQVIFSEYVVGWAGPGLGQTFEESESGFLDIWDGYPAERQEIIGHLADNAIDNNVFLTGDFHSTFAFDVASEPSLLGATALGVSAAGGDPTSVITYDPTTGIGSVGVEFATPSITSANFDENLLPLLGGDATATAQTVALLEFQSNNPLGPEAGALEGVTPNPHMKHNDLDQHGYFILDVTATQVQADWFYVDILNASDDSETEGAHYFAQDAATNANGVNTLQAAAEAAAPKPVQDTPAPEGQAVLSTEDGKQLALMSLYPNPAGDFCLLNYGLAQAGRARVSVVDVAGKTVKTALNERQAAGNYTMALSLEGLEAGLYVLRLEANGQVVSRKFVKQ